MDNKSWIIRRYTASDREEWNDFVHSSRNATFLFNRGFMEYHADRFDDFSLMAFYGGRLSALLPANRADNRLESHGGLTYGGWLLPADRIDAHAVLELFETLISYCRTEGIREVIYKTVPYIYHKRPAQEDLYALWRIGAKRIVCNISCAIDTPETAVFNRMQNKNLRFISKNYPDLRFVELSDATPVMEIVQGCLSERHNAVPVHTGAELQMLYDRFPDNIRFYGIEGSEGLEVGACIFLTDSVAHAQYIDTAPRARRDRALTLMISELLRQPEIRARRWFDFGTSNEDAGRILNAGLYSNKFSFGGGGVAYEQYLIKI
ncbi:MAG: GNAT family N-acetyltransferase [Muribaculaceae bacterium]|nr:GNAT family N-acetyltransferase [Muribaculaceae bacterium]